MKPLLLLAVGAVTLAFAIPTANAGGRVGFFFNTGGCYRPAPVYCAPRPICPPVYCPPAYYAPPIVYYRSAPVYAYTAPVFSRPAVAAVPVCPPPVAISTPVRVSTATFSWRR